MENKEYQKLTHTTNIYPEDKMLECLTLGICSEAGEIADKVKKFHRGDKFVSIDSGLKMLLLAEIGDLLWYSAETLTEIGFTISDAMEYNIKKLESRKQRNVINGSGDER